MNQTMSSMNCSNMNVEKTLTPLLWGNFKVLTTCKIGKTIKKSDIDPPSTGIKIEKY